jgi:hypothetical protein
LHESPMSIVDVFFFGYRIEQDTMQSFLIPSLRNWFNRQVLENRSFVCGYCGDKVSSASGYKIGDKSDGSGVPRGGIYICSNCQGPNFFAPDDRRFPSPPFGQSVSHVPGDLDSLYEEARRCTALTCYTASVLLCRKMLMNIAVQQGAEEGLKFIQYVDYLASKGFIPPNGRHWVDHIRKKGNEATHEIALMEEQDARELLVFSEMLLKFIYEFPSMVTSSQ